MKLVMKTSRLFLMNKKISRAKRKHNIRMMNSQRSDVEKISLIEEGKRIGINEVFKRNEYINNSLLIIKVRIYTK